MNNSKDNLDKLKYKSPKDFRANLTKKLESFSKTCPSSKDRISN